ncbi:MAG TPA: hypothetical protein VML00_01560 [Bacteroidota bacterium]|nr:hypothetical protein [Bacteroidota bacterium]
MTNRNRVLMFGLLLLAAAGPLAADLRAQIELQTTRGRIWEDMQNDGWIGSLGAWDYLTPAPLGMFPGFAGFTHPIGNENNAINTFANANFHNFRSGVFVIARNLVTPGAPPTYTPVQTPVETYLSGLQDNTYGAESVPAPLVLSQNFCGSAGYNGSLPEEMITAQWNTNSGVTVTRRSYAWSFPGYSDFIIWDYVFTNTGKIVCDYTSQVIPDANLPRFVQTLNDVHFAFHSGISVSTKSQINFHAELTAVQAGAFGWLPPAYHDYYHIFDKGALVFSTNYNGGKAPLPWDAYAIKPNSQWQQKFGPELESPAAFGWLALYASPTGAVPRTTYEPDVLRIDCHKGGLFKGQSLDLERFRIVTGTPKQDFYDFCATPDTQAALGNSGNRFNFYTLSYGPYKLAPGDSVHIIVAEIAGVMDMNEVSAGDPQGHFPDSTIAAIRRNADNARNAVKWGMGANVNGIRIAAAVPAPPPPPAVDAVNASSGTQSAAIAVTWTKAAETATLTDGAGKTYYNGATDLDGYRVYKSTDFQYSSETQLPAFRGEAWTQIADIPRSDFGKYFDATLGKYRIVDNSVQFGFKYGYYVSAYTNASTSRSWTSPNGTVVSPLPALASGSVNKTPPASASPGPVSTMDVFVAPNPYVFGDPARSFGINNPYGIEFRNLPETCTIRIYTIMGDLVRKIEHAPDARGNVYGSEAWDQKSDSGLLVAPGLYVYNVQSRVPGLDKSITGKLMIIR